MRLTVDCGPAIQSFARRQEAKGQPTSRLTETKYRESVRQRGNFSGGWLSVETLDYWGVKPRNERRRREEGY